MKKISLVALVAAFSVFALPVVGLAQVDTTEAFVCPVISSEALENNPQAVPLGDTETYTVAPPTAHHFMVPTHATNGDGSGIPGDPDQSVPGDIDYTAIWAVQE